MRTGLKAVIVRGGGWLARAARGRVVVLCYHSIHPSRPFASATPKLFEEHLRWLKDHCTVVPFGRVVKSVVASNKRDRPVVGLTFDDGYADNHEYAFPLLQRLDLPATFFVTVGLLEKDPAVVERFQRLRQSGYEEIRPLEWAQVREMRRFGMEFGAHTYTHPNLAGLSRAGAHTELGRSKAVLEERLGEGIDLMAYPFGVPRRHFTSETVRLVADIGYRSAAASMFRDVRASDSPLAIPRFFVAGDTLEVLKAKVRGAWDLVGAWQERAPLWLAKIVSREDLRV